MKITIELYILKLAKVLHFNNFNFLEQISPKEDSFVRKQKK